MEEIIAKSKKAKFERQHQKEKTLEATEDVDAQWKKLLVEGAMTSKKKPGEGDGTAKREPDDYDKWLREMKFDARGAVSSK